MSRVTSNDADGFVIEIARTKPVRPPKYTVVMYNDDYTPAEFVVRLLEGVFRMERAAAVATMLAVHRRGASACGTYPRDVAETKLAEALALSASEGHPLKLEMQPE